MIIFFCVFILIIIVIKILIRFSTLRINIKELEVKNKKILRFNLQISLRFLNKIAWVKVTLDDKRINKLKDNKRMEIINKILNTRLLKKYKNINKVIIKQWKQILKQVTKTEIEKLNLDAIIGTESADTTAYATSAISIALPIILGRKVSDLSYKVKPIYINKNYIYISLKSIISIKLVHIISVRKELKRKEVYQ